MLSLSTMQTSAPLVVKLTFLDVMDEVSEARRFSLRRRAHTDSALLEPAGLEEYTPGLFADSAVSSGSKLHCDNIKADSDLIDVSDSETAVPGSSASSTGRAGFSASSSAASSRSSSPAPEEFCAASTSSRPSRLQRQQARARPLPAGQISSAAEQQPRTKADQVESRTTVMLRNMPNNYTRAMLLALLDEEGFAGKYDFLYIPFDFSRRAGLGYAFINLVDAASAQRFWRTFNGFSRWVIPTAKVSTVSWSDPLQGLAANVERYRNSPVMHPKVPEEYRPVLLKNGVRVEFPKPTKAIRPPMSRS